MSAKNLDPTPDDALYKGSKMIEKYCIKYNLKDPVPNLAEHLYRLVSKTHSHKGSSTKASVAACIFVACREHVSVEFIPVCYELEADIRNSFRALWGVECCSVGIKPLDTYPVVKYQSSDWRDNATYSIVIAGTGEPRKIRFHWSDVPVYTLRGNYSSMHPSLHDFHHAQSLAVKVKGEDSSAKKMAPKKVVTKEASIKGVAAKETAGQKVTSKKVTAKKMVAKEVVAQEMVAKEAVAQEVTEIHDEKNQLGENDAFTKAVKEIMKTDTVNWIHDPKSQSGKKDASTKAVLKGKKADPGSKIHDHKSQSGEKDTYIKAVLEVKEVDTSGKIGHQKSESGDDENHSQTSEVLSKKEDHEWDLVNFMDDTDKDESWIEISGEEVTADKKELRGLVASMKKLLM